MPGAADAASVLVYTRADCPLCDAAVDLTRELAPALGFGVHLRDVDADPALIDQYGDRVPVVVVGDVVVAEGVVERAALREALLRARGNPS